MYDIFNTIIDVRFIVKLLKNYKTFVSLSLFLSLSLHLTYVFGVFT